MIWNEEFETLPREALEALQLKRLHGLVDRVCTTVPFYRRKFEEQGYRQGTSGPCRTCPAFRSPRRRT